MRTNWKAKYQELVIAAEKHMRCIEDRSNILNAFMIGGRNRPECLGTLPGRYADEFSAVYQLLDGRILIASNCGFLNEFNNLQDAIDFYGILSKSDDNLKSIEILRGLLPKAA